MVDLLDVGPVIIAVVGGIVGTIVTIITQKRSLAKEVKEHTDLKVNNLQQIMEVKLETIEYKVTTHENLLIEIKKVNKEDVLLMKQELQSLRDEITEIQKEGTAPSKIRAEALEKRIELLEKKIDYVFDRAFEGKKTPI